MATDVPTFRLRFPEFSDNVEYTDERIQLFLDDAANCYMGTDENHWCAKYDYAQSYLAAHLLVAGGATESGDSSNTVGPISSKVAGGVSVSRAVTTKDRSDTDDFYLKTSYGQQFKNIRDQCFVGVAVATC